MVGADTAHASKRREPGGEDGVLKAEALSDRLAMEPGERFIEMLELAQGQQLDGEP